MITLTTDFGDSAYTGAMRGSILSIHPDAKVVDLTHAVPAQDVTSGALALHASAPVFPEGTVHVCVVDPGVGTDRRGLLLETRRGLLVGPDNGVLVPAAEQMGLQRARVIENPDLWRHPVSATFHGRDVFGPVAAHLDAGRDPEDVGPITDAFERLDFGTPQAAADGLEARILAVDGFGNAILNVPDALARDALTPGARVATHVGDTRLQVPFVRTFGDVPRGEALLYVGSSGFLELAVREGSAAATFHLDAGQSVRLTDRP